MHPPPNLSPSGCIPDLPFLLTQPRGTYYPGLLSLDNPLVCSNYHLVGNIYILYKVRLIWCAQAMYSVVSAISAGTENNLPR